MAIPETETKTDPMDEIVEIETRRLRLRIKKNALCKAAGVKPEMLAYMLRRARDRKSLPESCLKKIRIALSKLERINANPINKNRA